MRLEHYSVEKLKKEILEIVGKYLDLDVYKVFFFGSRVSGKGSDRSDIDVGIEGPSLVPAKILLDIQEEVENMSTLYKVEVVDFHRVASLFRKVALQHIERITLYDHKISSRQTRV